MGGKAFQDVEPVNKRHVARTIARLQNLLGGFDYRTLGSTGKKNYSGDIDLAVSDKQWTYGDLVDKLKNALGSENVNTNGSQFNQVYTRMPICDKMAQVDFMLGNINLLAFTHWSPDSNTSNYTGSHRTEYIKAVAKALSTTAERSGRHVARVGYTLHHDRGLVYSARWCAPRKDGTGFITKMTDVPDDKVGEFLALFPELSFVGRKQFVSPTSICANLFGSKVTPNHVTSYERVAQCISNNVELLKIKDLIWRLYLDRLDEIGLPHPGRII